MRPRLAKVAVKLAPDITEKDPGDQAPHTPITEVSGLDDQGDPGQLAPRVETDA